MMLCGFRHMPWKLVIVFLTRDRAFFPEGSGRYAVKIFSCDYFSQGFCLLMELIRTWLDATVSIGPPFCSVAGWTLLECEWSGNGMFVELSDLEQYHPVLPLGVISSVDSVPEDPGKNNFDKIPSGLKWFSSHSSSRYHLQLTINCDLFSLWRCSSKELPSF